MLLLKLSVGIEIKGLVYCKDSCKAIKYPCKKRSACIRRRGSSYGKQVRPHHLPQGMRVAISPYTLHRNPTYFPDPERFDPDRWTLENEVNIPRYAYL